MIILKPIKSKYFRIISKETNVLGDNAQISVGKKPSYISGGLHVIYVANTDSGT